MRLERGRGIRGSRTSAAPLRGEAVSLLRVTALFFGAGPTAKDEQAEAGDCPRIRTRTGLYCKGASAQGRARKGVDSAGDGGPV